MFRSIKLYLMCIMDIITAKLHSEDQFTDELIQCIKYNINLEISKRLINKISTSFLIMIQKHVNIIKIIYIFKLGYSFIFMFLSKYNLHVKIII